MNTLTLTLTEREDLLAERGIFGAYPALTSLLGDQEDREDYLAPPRPDRPPPGPAPPCAVCGEADSDRRCDVCGASGHEMCLGENLMCSCCHAPTYWFDWAKGDYNIGAIGVDNVFESLWPGMAENFRESHDGREPTEGEVEEMKASLATVLASRFEM